jgi:hypothetical protein
VKQDGLDNDFNRGPSITDEILEVLAIGLRQHMNIQLSSSLEKFEEQKGSLASNAMTHAQLIG